MASILPLRSLATALFAFSAVPPCLAQVVNAPVAPDTIYVARSGAGVSLSVIDLNGFGASTGDPTFDPTYTTFPEGNSNYPNNPNVRYQGSLLRPPLAPGTSTLDGGSAGVFTLTKNSVLSDELLGGADLSSISDMMLGHSLDTIFNNGPAPFGCQAGGGNLCANDGFHGAQVGEGGPNTTEPHESGPVLNSYHGLGNPISWAPHPNPPPLIVPPLCQVPHIRGQEPTSVETLTLGLANLLVPGDPFGDPTNGVPPTGLLATEQNNFFIGPSLPQPVISACLPYPYRQQIGHFLYIADRARGQVLVANSNTLEVLRRISVPDPVEFAMSPNLSLLAVSSRHTDSVVFIDIDPTSSTFHRIVHTTPVGDAPRGIAWDPGNEDILVCNEADDSVSILSAATLSVRKVVRRLLDRPFAVAITPRQQSFGFQRNVYFAYILDRAGHVTLFESGPSGVNGWGYDEIIGRAPFVFAHPRAIQPDPLRLTSGVWVAHEGQLGTDGQPTGMPGGAVTNLVIDSAVVGMIPLIFNDRPHLRDMSLAIARSIGNDRLSGVPLDIAFDDQRNYGVLADYATPFSAGAPSPINGKNLVRQLLFPASRVVNTNEATYLFVPIRGAGVVDVIRLSDGERVDTNAHQPGVQSIPASGAAVVMNYFRQ